MASRKTHESAMQHIGWPSWNDVTSVCCILCAGGFRLSTEGTDASCNVWAFEWARAAPKWRSFVEGHDIANDPPKMPRSSLVFFWNIHVWKQPWRQIAAILVWMQEISTQTRDRIVSFGERLSVRAFSAAFNQSKSPEDWQNDDCYSDCKRFLGSGCTLIFWAIQSANL